MKMSFPTYQSVEAHVGVVRGSRSTVNCPFTLLRYSTVLIKELGIVTIELSPPLMRGNGKTILTRIIKDKNKALYFRLSSLIEEIADGKRIQYRTPISGEIKRIGSLNGANKPECRIP